MRDFTKNINGSLILGLMTVALSSPASAQLYKDAWSFSNQNRASIAALIKQVDDGDKASGATVAAGAGGGTTLVCGADADSTAKGNSSCIILNNSTGDIEIGQDSVGDQTASNESSDTITVDESISGADDILDALHGN